MSATDASEAHDEEAGHGHAGIEAEPLGEVDVTAWAAAVIGAGIAFLLIIAMYVAVGS